MPNSSICLIDRTLSGATTPSQSGPGSDGYEAPALLEPQHQIFLISYPALSLGESYPSADMQSVHSTTPANWAIKNP